MEKTCLTKYYDMVNEGETRQTHMRDTWEIPNEGTEIWCTGWKQAQTIKPCGDGAHVVIGFTGYHCDELMGILTHWNEEGQKWGIDGVTPTREQQINGRWILVKYSDPNERKLE